MPKTLDGTYARILCNIDKAHSQYALKLLQWLTYSARPLQIRELAKVLAIDVNGSPRFDPERRFADPQDILELCPSLVILKSSKSKAFDDEARTKYIALAHSSVKEYLISERIKEGPARSFSIERLSSNRSMAEDCLAYLLQFDQEDSLTSGTLDLRLARYAARFWTLHARVAELGTNTAVKLSMELFRTADVSFSNWLRLRDPHKCRFRRVERYPKHIASPLYYASRAGLLKSVEVLLRKGADVNEQGGEHGDALSAASYYGHERVVDLLLRSSAHINSRGGVKGNALLAASLNGHEELVRLLIRHGADVNHQGGRYNSALQAASFGGFTKIGQLLLDYGAQVNAQGGFYGSALLAALVHRREEVIQLLIAHSADPSLGDIQGINALHEASALGRLTLLDVFSTRGSDLKIVDKQGRNCLHHAASRTRTSQRSPKCLLHQGMNLDLPDRDGWTALHWAAKRGNVDTIKTLKEAGAVFSKENINGGPHMMWQCTIMGHHCQLLYSSLIRLYHLYQSSNKLRQRVCLRRKVGMC
jgi:ankyrin repeat protein